MAPRRLADVSRLSQREQAKILLARYADDPVLFAREVLGIKPWKRQAEILRAVAAHRKVAVKSGHKVGKSTTMAILALWWVCTKYRGRVVMSSSTARQVRIILWKELKRLYHGARIPLGGKLAEDPATGLVYLDGRDVLGFSTDTPENMAGVSSPNLLYLLDEASGIDEAVYEAVEGNLAGGGSIVLCSNPTRVSGKFYLAFNAQREFWHTIHISSEDTPNVLAGRVVVPGLATREWVEEQRKLYGEESAYFQVRVRGNFPAQSSDCVIPLHFVELARARWDAMEADATPWEGELHLGVDVAREGDDDSVIYPRRGYRAGRPKVVHGFDSIEVAGTALDLAREMLVEGEKPHFKVDIIGWGAGTGDVIKRNESVTYSPINVAENATAEGYHRLRDQIWFAMRDWLAEGGAIPPDPKLEAELVAPTYHHDEQGRRRVDSKDKIKAVLKRSPDRADALALSIYRPPVAPPPMVQVEDTRFDLLAS